MEKPRTITEYAESVEKENNIQGHCHDHINENEIKGILSCWAIYYDRIGKKEIANAIKELI